MISATANARPKSLLIMTSFGLMDGAHGRASRFWSDQQ
jgi:hypothetical protein